METELQHRTNVHLEQIAPPDPKPLLPAVPMWTMVAERGFRYHFATDTFVSFCGRSNLYVRDYVEFIDGAVRKVGEARQVFGAINESSTCKICLAAVKLKQKIL